MSILQKMNDGNLVPRPQCMSQSHLLMQNWLCTWGVVAFIKYVQRKLLKCLSLWIYSRECVCNIVIKMHASVLSCVSGEKSPH